MKASPLEVHICEHCQSFVPPARIGWHPRCVLTGLPVCRKALGCHFYTTRPGAPVETRIRANIERL